MLKYRDNSLWRRRLKALRVGMALRMTELARLLLKVIHVVTDTLQGQAEIQVFLSCET